MQRRGRERFFRIALACAASAFLVAACHEFHVCYDPDCGTTAAGGDSTAGSAGNLGTSGSGGESGGNASGGGARDAAGAAGDGEAGASFCPPHWGDCDESTLNGCEADLTADIANCGKCQARCVGICSAGKCQVFEPLASPVDVLATGSIAFTADHVYCLSGDLLDGTPDLVRAAKDLSGFETLLKAGPGARTLLTGVDRIYLAAAYDEQLFSVLLSGGALQDEKLVVGSAARSGTFLYYDDGHGQTNRRSEFGHAIEALPPIPAYAEYDDVLLTADDASVSIVRSNSDDTDAYSYFVYRLDDLLHPSAWKLLATGAGNPVRVRTGADGVFIAVTLGSTAELREITLDGHTHLLTQVPQIADFALYGNAAYVSWSGTGETAGLRVVSIQDPVGGTLDYATIGAFTSLEIDGQFLYFGDRMRHTLSRVPFWIEAG